MKRIIICCDGTWQAAFDDTAPTNIQRITELLKPETDDGLPQIIYYDPGIGTAGDKYSGGLRGNGIDLNIMEAYKFIIDNYVPGDEIYCFGFSRGAYTVRSLLSLIYSCGILKKDGFVDNQGNITWYSAALISYAYDIYRSRLPQHAPKNRLNNFPASQSYHLVPIAFLGVFDTVGALGIPGKILGKLQDKNQYQFHDTKLNPYIKKARHALALDEERKDFIPTLWQTADSHPEVPYKTDSLQMWFVGDHSDIGGGHGKLDENETERGLSNITLHWMLKESGLAYYEEPLKRYKSDVYGKIHSSFEEEDIFKRLAYHYLGKVSRKITGTGSAGQDDIELSPSALERILNDPSYIPKAKSPQALKKDLPTEIKSKLECDIRK